MAAIWCGRESMDTASIVLLVILAFIVLGIAFVWALYNGLVRARLRVQEAWSGIDVQLKRRSSLVPNLVETVRGYAQHEREVFQRVTEARAALMNARDARSAAAADNMLTGALKSLFAVAEAYPELKANTNFLQLQSQLQELENNLESARRYYNAIVRDYNIATETFPSNLIASTFNFKREELFQLEAPEAERKAPKVSFS
jgi:LemA protein